MNGAASRASAQGAVLDMDAAADRAILDAFQTGLSDAQTDRITSVHIYRADESAGHSTHVGNSRFRVT